MSEVGNVWNYVVGAYAVTWLVLTGYALRIYVLNRRANRMKRELEVGE